MMIAGIGVSVLGLGSIGGGVAATVAGARQCDADASNASREVSRLSLADQGAVRTAARDRCRDNSDLMAVGLGAVIGGSVLAAAGVAFTIAGAWKVGSKHEPPKRTTELRVTPGFVMLVGTL